MTLYLGTFINGLTHFLAKLRQTSRVSLFFMRKTFIPALHQGKSVQNRGQSVILSGENHRLPYTITGGDKVKLHQSTLRDCFLRGARPSGEGENYADTRRQCSDCKVQRK